MRAVNLLPPRAPKGLDAGGRKPLLVAGGGIVVVTLLATLLATRRGVDASDTRSELESLEAAIASFPSPNARGGRGHARAGAHRPASALAAAL